MPGPSGVIGRIVNVVATGNVNLSDMGSAASWRRAQFFFETTAVTRTTGSFVVQLRYITPDGTLIVIATSPSITATSVVELTIDSAFADPEDIVPDGSEIRVTITGDATAISGNLYRFAA